MGDDEELELDDDDDDEDVEDGIEEDIVESWEGAGAWNVSLEGCPQDTPPLLSSPQHAQF